MREPTASTTGLPTHTASTLAYMGWWVTGLIFWVVERRDELVRFHAAQATIAFGGLALLILACAAFGLLMLTFAPAAFSVFLGAAVIAWTLSVLLWILALPIAARLADRFVKTSGFRPQGSGLSQAPGSD
ncbi:MAG: hypothetical protein E6G67_13710 [Actinobacteria bacterium]|nr:MAG: hypothetical protein E6G67_13710 [Actinomycetota bacterium]